MMKKKALIIVLYCMLFNLTFAQYKLVETVEPDKDNFKTVIPYTKYTFDNGLTVILQEDHSDPIFHFNLSFGVGSVNENPDLAGNAYLISQLMNNTSGKIPGGDYKEFIRAYGGVSETSISRDRTVYSVTAPVTLLKAILWLESERIGNFENSLTEDNFINAKEKAIQAINDYLTSPNGKLDVVTNKTVYEFGHPYSWTPYGKKAHLERVTLNELKKFYLDWYGSNNAILTISGDFNTKKILKAIKKYYGGLTRSPMISKTVDDKMALIVPGSKIDLTEDRYFNYQSSSKAPKLRIIYPTVPKYHKDAAALNIFADFLGGDNYSFLQRSFRNDTLIRKINASHVTSKYSGEFIIDVEALPDASLAQVKDVVTSLIDSVFGLENMDKIIRKPPDRNDINAEPFFVMDLHLFNKYINSYRTNLKMSLETCKGKAEKLSEYEFFLKNPNSIDKDITDHNFFNPEKIIKPCNDYLIGTPAIFISAVPKGKMNLVAKSSDYRPNSLKSIINPVTEEMLTHREPTSNKWKRLPKIKKPVNVVVPTYNKSKLEENNLNILTSSIEEMPTIVIKMKTAFPQFMQFETNVDLAEFTAAIMNAKIQTFRKGELLQMMGDMGLTLSFDVSGGKMITTFKALGENFTSNTVFIREALFQKDAMEQDIEFSKAVDDLKTNIRPENFNHFNLARNASLAISAPGEPVGEELSEFEGDEYLKRMTENVFANMDMIFSPSKSTVAILGNIREGDFFVFKEPFREWMDHSTGGIPDFERPEGEVSESKMADQNNLFVFNQYGYGTNCKVVITYKDIPVDQESGNYTKARFIEFLLDGLNNEFTEIAFNKSYIHWINSKLVKDNNSSMLMFEAFVEADKVDSALFVFTEIIDNLKNKTINKKRFKKELAVQFALQDVIKYETAEDKADLLFLLQDYDLSDDYFDRLPKAAKKTKISAINEYASKFLSENKRNILIAGEKRKFKDKLSKLDLGAVKEINEHGRMIK